MSGKQAVQVLIRTRPTDQFAAENLKVNTNNGVSNCKLLTVFGRRYWFTRTKKMKEQ